MSEKRCSKCKEVKPATLEYFHKGKGSYQLHYECKECSNERRRIRGRMPVPSPADGIQKKCTQCQEVKPATLEYFHKGGGSYGLYSACKECKNPQNLARKHTPEGRARTKFQSIHRNKDTQRRYDQSENGKISHSKAQNRRRALLQGSPSTYTADEWKALLTFYGNTCLCCGIKGKDTKIGQLTADHVIPLSQGGTNSIDNIQPLCKPCNLSKGTRTIDYRPHVKTFPKQLRLFEI